ncbi:MAG: D-alanyl-D-alanine carboxypeptidase [Devosiaceae bacterium]|nr:D-alanyl-D-alanine carboxypeptidase [Devosiaceae bacterium]
MRTLKNSILMFFSFLLLAFSQPILAQPQLLLDMRTGKVLYEKNAGIAWYPASLTKLMTLYIAFEAIENGRLTLSTPVIISAQAKKAPPSRSPLPANNAITLKDALYLVNVKSANDVAIALAETISGNQAAFIIKMNETAKKLGMSGTNFTNPNGLHSQLQITTARDLAILALSIRAKYPQYNSIFATYEIKLGETIMQSYNRLLINLWGTNGMKTGFICAAGYNIIATAKRDDKSLMAIVLGASSERERNEMAAQLLLKGFSGELSSTNKIITNIANEFSQTAKNMRPLICNSQNRNYVINQEKEFPFGLNSQPSFLNDRVITTTIKITSLGKIKSAPIPKPRINRQITH